MYCFRKTVATENDIFANNKTLNAANVNQLHAVALTTNTNTHTEQHWLMSDMFVSFHAVNSANVNTS